MNCVQFSTLASLGRRARVASCGATDIVSPGRSLHSPVISYSASLPQVSWRQKYEHEASVKLQGGRARAGVPVRCLPD